MSKITIQDLDPRPTMLLGIKADEVTRADQMGPSNSTQKSSDTSATLLQLLLSSINQEEASSFNGSVPKWMLR